ncbi:hypothetical protein bpuCAU1_001620 (plasmid) [Borrelia puertoricensis]|uniref:hypothetical protein n=1 Tax=Borrelia puertoricensis TaxID=2756107 RepID=UPI003EC03EC4
MKCVIFMIVCLVLSCILENEKKVDIQDINKQIDNNALKINNLSSKKHSESKITLGVINHS